MRRSEVTVLDLRTDSTVGSAELAGGVVVVDDAGSLVDHAESYLSLGGEGMVTGVICVAVGESTTGNPLDGVVLEVPPGLQYATVLWAGDARGVDWAPGAASPLPTDGTVDGLDELVAALRVPEVFQRVVDVVG